MSTNFFPKKLIDFFHGSLSFSKLTIAERTFILAILFIDIVMLNTNIRVILWGF